ncbi:hypothetical protein DFH09DRAFT_172748 [Mycena vulgaris]|nr:hypothetical protein DFH09DRAFT_172748 [Mycena vulgaris]
MTARKRRRLNDAGIFFDLAAVDGSEEDDDDDDWEDDFVQPDEFLAIRAKQGSNPGALFLGPPADEAADDRRDAEERAKRYLTRAGEADGAGHPRPLWKVAVVKGREADVADTVETLVAGGEALANVDCAWDIPAVRGFVYIAADKEALEELYESVAFVKPRPRAIAVAPEDAVAHLLGGDLPADKLKYSWVRFTGRGIYCGDLAWVQDAASPDTVHLLIVPRHGEITRPRKRSGYGAPARPPRRLHKQESDTDEQRPTPSARHNQTEFVGGLLLMRSVAVTQLCEEAVEATEDEVRLFQLSPLYAELGEARQGYSRLLEEIAAHVDRMCRMLPRAPAGSAEAAPGTRPEERMADQIRLVADRFRTVEVRAAAEAELEARARRHRQQRREEVEIRTNIIGAREARATAMRAVDKALGARGINVADMEALENEQVPPAEQWKILGEQQWLARCHKIDAEFMLEDGVARQDIESEQAVHDLALWMKLLLGNEWRGWPGGGGRDPETIRREIADKYAVREGRLPPLASTAPRAGLDDLHPGVRWLQDGADQPGFHMLWIYLLNFAREASAARRRLWDALALFNRPADPDYSELYLHCICLKEIFAVQRAPLDLAAGDSVRVCNGEYTGLVGRVEAVDGAHVEIEADNVSLNGVSLSGDRLCINAAILEYNFVVGDLVEVKHGWRVGDKGHLVDIHWDKGWGEVFRPPPALRTPSRDVDDAVAGFEMVSSSVIHKCRGLRGGLVPGEAGLLAPMLGSFSPECDARCRHGGGVWARRQERCQRRHPRGPSPQTTCKGRGKGPIPRNGS